MSVQGDIVVSLEQLRERLKTDLVDRWIEGKRVLDEWALSLQRRIDDSLAAGELLQDGNELNRGYERKPKHDSLQDSGIATSADLVELRRLVREKNDVSVSCSQLHKAQPESFKSTLTLAATIVATSMLMAWVIHGAFLLFAPVGFWLVFNNLANTSERNSRINEQEERLRRLNAEVAIESKRLRTKLQASGRAKYDQRLDELAQEMRRLSQTLRAQCDALIDPMGLALWPWDDQRWSAYTPVSSSHHLIRFGAYGVSDSIIQGYAGELPRAAVDVSIPAVFRFPTGKPLYFAGSVNKQLMVEQVHGMLTRILAATPAGKLRLLFIDPVGRGQNAAPFMHLGDHDEKLITGKAWTEPDQIEQRLRDLTEHLENVIQKYLRNQFATIEEYNEHAEEIAEPYRVVVVFDYDIAFTDAATKRLHSLVESGPRCGIFPIIVAGKADTRPWPGACSVITTSNGTVVTGLSDDAPTRSEATRHARELHVGEVYEGVVANLRGNVAYVELERSQTGTLHISQITGKWVTSLESHVRPGQRIRAKISEIGPNGSPRLTMIGVDQPRLSNVPAPAASGVISFKFDEPCKPGLLAKIVADVGSQAVHNMVVAVPYAKMLGLAGIDPGRPKTWWRTPDTGVEQSAADALEVPLGPTGAEKLQMLVLGKGTAHHVLIAGRTGSGKSNLLHVIITTLALKYSPQEVELFLVDFKKGVEFKAYANHRLPHAHVIAIESEREFGLSVLRGLDGRMQARGEAFRRLQANDIAEFRRKSGDLVPRIVLIVDEFHEFFSVDDAIATEAAGLLDRLVRQGRSFGIHVILGSQSLAGSSMLPRSTLDQMQVRIALPCSAADSRLILADDNESARLLSRPGEAIYNAASGMEEGNQFFQIALFDDQVRDTLLGQLEQLGTLDRRPIVFEGHDAADLMVCKPLEDLLKSGSTSASINSAPAWVGEPITLDPPVELRFRRQSGANAVVVTRDEEEAMGVITASLLCMASGLPPKEARFVIIDFSTSDAPWARLCEDLAAALPHQVEIIGRKDIPDRLKQLCEEINRRSGNEVAAGHWAGFLVIVGLQRARDLRLDDESRYTRDSSRDGLNPVESLATILREGPELGIHTLVWCDNYPNLVRAVDTRGLREFGYRIAGSMSLDESMRLLDDAKASLLDRPHRMVFYDDSNAGSVRAFRPYQLPTPQWLQTVSGELRQRYEQEKRR